MKAHFELTFLDNNSRIDVTLPWGSFSLYEKICDNCGIIYHLKIKIIESGRVKCWYEPEDIPEPTMYPPLQISAEETFDTFMLFDDDLLYYLNDKGSIKQPEIDRKTEAKLLCLEKIYNNLMKLPEERWKAV